jgi:plastocyanin
MSMLSRPVLIAVALTIGAAACGDDDDPTIGGGGPIGGTEAAGAEATIVGEDTAFDVTSLDAQVGEPLTITFDNRDEGIQHNLHVEGTADGDAMTEITEGPVTQTLEVTFDEAGDFEYRCDVHPQQMQGTITVTDGG